MAEIEVFPQKIVDTRTLILKSRLDSKAAILQGEKLKTSFFTKFGFLKPKSEDVALTAFNKYYEPYIVIGGKYSIDYCKRHNYAIRVENTTKEIYIDGKKLKSEPLTPEKTAKVIKLVGEEHAHYENETYLILDRMMQEVTPENLPFAPFEHEQENNPEADFDLRRTKITLEEEIAILRSRIAKRPPDVAEIVREIFEINERTIIYSPIYEINFQNNKNGKNIIALINGITGEVAIAKNEKITSSEKLAPESIEIYRSVENLSATKAEFFQRDSKPSQTLNNPHMSNPTAMDRNENAAVGKTRDDLPNSQKQENTIGSTAENATHLAADFLKRLGYVHDQIPTKMYRDGETEVVEVSLQKANAIVHIDNKTMEVKGYEIQDTEINQGFFKSKRRLILILSSIFTVAIVLKLLNIF